MQVTESFSVLSGYFTDRCQPVHILLERCYGGLTCLPTPGRLDLRDQDMQQADAFINGPFKQAPPVLRRCQITQIRVVHHCPQFFIGEAAEAQSYPWSLHTRPSRQSAAASATRGCLELVCGG